MWDITHKLSMQKVPCSNPRMHKKVLIFKINLLISQSTFYQQGQTDAYRQAYEEILLGLERWPRGQGTCLAYTTPWFDPQYCTHRARRHSDPGAPEIAAQGTEVQGHPLLHRKLKASLDYKKPSLKKKYEKSIGRCSRTYGIKDSGLKPQCDRAMPLCLFLFQQLQLQTLPASGTGEHAGNQGDSPTAKQFDMREGRG